MVRGRGECAPSPAMMRAQTKFRSHLRQSSAHAGPVYHLPHNATGGALTVLFALVLFPATADDDNPSGLWRFAGGGCRIPQRGQAVRCLARHTPLQTRCPPRWDPGATMRRSF